MAFARIFPWVYSCLESLADDPQYETPANKPQQLWTKAENQSWLRSRLLPRTGNANELRTRVAENWNKPKASPTGGPMREVRHVIVSWWALVSQLMGMVEGNRTTANVTARLVRLFLTKVYDHDESTCTLLDRKLPMWHSQYNFLSLLNLPDQIEQLGPVRNRWDGGLRGEKFVMRAKPNIKSIKAKNWSKNLILNLLRQRELLVLQCHKDETGNSELGDEEENSTDEPPADTAAYTTYRSYSDIIRDVANKEPISCLLSVNNLDELSIYCCFRRENRNQFLVQINLQGQPHYQFGMWYYAIHLGGEEDGAMVGIKLMDVKVSSYGLLLPSGSQNRYTIINSHWKVLNQERRLVLPHMYIQREYSNTN